MKFLADENLHGDILRGLLAQLPDLDIVRVQDTTFKGASDEARLTHDVRPLQSMPMIACVLVRQCQQLSK